MLIRIRPKKKLHSVRAGGYLASMLKKYKAFRIPCELILLNIKTSMHRAPTYYLTHNPGVKFNDNYSIVPSLLKLTLNNM